MNKHIPGPWKADTAAPYMIRDRHSRPIAECPIYLGPDIEAANARLIAEAPAMFEILRQLHTGDTTPAAIDAMLATVDQILTRIEGA